MLRPVVFAIILQSAFAQQLKLATNYSGNDLYVLTLDELPELIPSICSFNLWNYMTGNDALNFWGDAGNQGD